MRLLARLVTSAHKYIMAFWILFVIVMAIFAIRLPGLLAGDGFRMDAEHEQVMEMASETFGLPAETMFVVFDQVPDEVIASTLANVETMGLVSEIDSPLDHEKQYSKDVSYALLHFNEPEKDRADVVTSIREAIGDEKGVTLTGQSAITKDINTASQRDLMKAEAIGLPIAIIVLLFAFGSVAASLVPLFVGIATVVSTFGVLTLIGGQMDLSIFVLNIVPMLGLALSIDFSLLFISRYREERKKNDIVDAVAITIRTAGRSVIFSAFCVFIGLGALFLIQVEIFQNIALGGMIIVGMAVLSSITLLPSILILLGDRINKGQVLKVKENGANRWRQFAKGVIKRPILITIVALVLLGTALIPAKNMDLTIPQIDSLPTSYDTRSSYELMDEAFGLGEQSSVYVIAERKDGWADTKGLAAMKQLQDELTSDSLVDSAATIYTASGIDSPAAWEQAMQVPDMKAQLDPLLDSFVQGQQLLIPVTLSASGTSDDAQDWARDWSTRKTEWNLLIGGQPKFNQEIFDEIFDNLVSVLLLIVVSTLFILMIAFRSILIPIKAILMNIIGLSATFGILVYIFQYGHFGLHPGTIALIIPVIIFSLVFGLSMDYEVFLISRMQEEYANTLDNDHSTVEGLAATSKIITSAALIMIVLTGAFAFTDVMPVKQIGVGIAIAVAIDATIIRLLLVPSLMKLFGKWNWWLPFRKGPYKAGNWH
ncbi:MMPL family transporter [Sporosarcina sp. Te-1]|uniref:MMPL family transporter n=1 Tax=Sporosarcina sp. Te-1 TaxID=2818390 RepID=UPI001A9E15CD|nr:MMPL family transporter [Sporosarcina sp. Te-1]QTD39683.1 MMPL family transporter [Sporosarcina sp. Te-1]